jgi:hypothetical protein
MNRPSVFTNPAPLPAKPVDRAAYFGMELSVCERLIGMGFRFSGAVRLADHIRWLEERIYSIHPKGRYA